MSNAVALREQAPRSVTMAMAERYGMEPLAFEATLRSTVVPKDCSKEQFAAFLLVAKEYGLNPITKEIYAFPSRGGGIQPIVGVDGWANLINSHPQCDGIEFTDTLDDKSELVSVTCRIYRKDRSRPTETTEYMAECKRNTDTWKQYPRRMLRHKALIQCARYAFGFAGIADPDEAERMGAGAPAAVLAPPPAPKSIPPSAPKTAAPKADPKAVQRAPQISGDWQDYLDRQRDEYLSAPDAGLKQAVSETVSDAITAAQERGEINGEQAEAIAEAWNDTWAKEDGA